MIYIHQLNNFNPKTVETEAVYLIRELKQKTPYPLTVDSVSAYFTDLLLSQTDQAAMEQARGLIDQLVPKIEQLLQEQSSLYEPVNLQRAIAILRELPSPLQQNITYFQSIIPWQQQYIQSLVPVLNGIPRATAMEDKKKWNAFLNIFFEKVLRTEQFAFNSQDILHEGPLAQIVGLSESMGRGFFFHVSLEEELKKVSYDVIKRRIPAENVQVVEDIREGIENIRRGIERGYHSNMRLVNWAVIMYSYVKWLSNPWEKQG